MNENKGKWRDHFETDEESLNHLLNRCVFYFHRHPSGPRQMAVLRLLKERGPMSQQDIQKAMDIQAGSISELLSKLELKGFIEKKRREDDRRKVVITLTDKGEELSATDTATSLHERYEILTDEEMKQLIFLLEKLLGSWDEEEKRK